ncbi:hypothetical protein FOA52_011972 [Chlamydomonas sp. UWO 241]|nr:hypothetical protein FOA52_011972 [Chlamydomonas sp. UWO 241]
MDLHPERPLPAARPSSTHRGHLLLPVVHKYNFTKLLKCMVTAIKEKSDVWLSANPSSRGPHGPQVCYVITWLVVAERLQLDELHDICVATLRCMPKQQLDIALTEVVAVVGGGGRMQRALRKEVVALGNETLSLLAGLLMARITAA